MRATFWLLDAPDSLAEQSRRNPDGYGLGMFGPDGSPHIDKSTAPAWEDAHFRARAREGESTRFVAHVRYASTGPVAYENSHPFGQRGRLFAHNGYVGGLEVLDRELGDYRALVAGETDSERLFALINRRIDEEGDVCRGIESALRWVASNLPVYSMNFVLTTPSELYAVRYPDTKPMLVLERGADLTDRERFDADGLELAAAGDSAQEPGVVVVASERMDPDPGWRPLRPGELVRVDEDLNVRRTLLLERPPAHQLTFEELDARVAASQIEPGEISVSADERACARV